MNWNKSANLIIMSLLILNVVLVLMNYMSSQKYVLAESQERTVVRLLAKNNIEVGDIVRNFAPLRAINMLPYNYDDEAIRATFLGIGEDIKRTSEFKNTKYTKGGETLIISANIVEYTNEKGTGAIDLTMDEARRTADNFYRSVLSGKLVGFFFNTAYEYGDAIIVDYRGSYRRNIIYSNYIKFSITQNGIVAITYEYQKPDGYHGAKKQICAPDEALMTFMYEARNVTQESIVISKMDLVYYLVEAPAQANIVVRATPFYRIYVQGRPHPVLINAFTNTIL